MEKTSICTPTTVRLPLKNAFPARLNTWQLQILKRTQLRISATLLLDTLLSATLLSDNLLSAALLLATLLSATLFLGKQK